MVYGWARWVLEGGSDSLCKERRVSIRRTITEVLEKLEHAYPKPERLVKIPGN